MAGPEPLLRYPGDIHQLSHHLFMDMSYGMSSKFKRVNGIGRSNGSTSTCWNESSGRSPLGILSSSSAIVLVSFDNFTVVSYINGERKVLPAPLEGDRTHLSAGHQPADLPVGSHYFGENECHCQPTFPPRPDSPQSGCSTRRSQGTCSTSWDLPMGISLPPSGTPSFQPLCLQSQITGCWW